ncbi:coagulation factor XIII B chain-like [Lissotriton helveticus]
MENNNVKLKWVEKEKIHSKHGQWIEFECISDEYVEDKTTPFRIQCYQGEIKYPRCIKIGEEQKCGAAPTISKGDITEKREESYISGSVLEYKCQESFKIKGPSKVTCQNGIWSELPECTA